MVRLQASHWVYLPGLGKGKYTATEYDLRSAHNHPEFFPRLKTSIWEETLHFAGSEPLITWEDTLKAHCIVQNVQFQEFDGF